MTHIAFSLRSLQRLRTCGSHSKTDISLGKVKRNHFLGLMGCQKTAERPGQYACMLVDGVREFIFLCSPLGFESGNIGSEN